MFALSIRQPYLELILRGIKTAELRSRPTKRIGERFYLYAAKARAHAPIWSSDLEVARPPAWLVELAAQVRLIEPEALALPTGVIVGTAVIDGIVEPDPRDGDRGLYQWRLADVRRLDPPRKPTRQPQPTWFRPF